MKIIFDGGEGLSYENLTRQILLTEIQVDFSTDLDSDSRVLEQMVLCLQPSLELLALVSSIFSASQGRLEQFVFEALEVRNTISSGLPLMGLCNFTKDYLFSQIRL